MNWLAPSEFEWEHAPLNKFWHAATAVSIYLLIISLLEKRAKTKGVNARRMRLLLFWQVYHNLFLCLGSLAMVISALFMTYKYKQGHYPEDPDTGTPFLTCTLTARPATGRLFYWVYIFYLSKYVELFDTIIQMAKGRRPPSFYFHVWHHTMYLLICWGYCEYRSSLAFMAVIINGSVHVIMYYYYHLSALGREVWWKSSITQVQIVQFIVGYGFVSAFAYRAFIQKLPCNGKQVLGLHAIFNLTMLIGFVRILARIRLTRKNKAYSPTSYNKSLSWSEQQAARATLLATENRHVDTNATPRTAST